jgi:hypothetical protein
VDGGCIVNRWLTFRFAFVLRQLNLLHTWSTLESHQFQFVLQFLLHEMECELHERCDIGAMVETENH